MELVDKKIRKEVFTIVDKNDRHLWVKLGAGFVNKDGSINLYLDALPVNGLLHIRDYEEKSRHQEVGRAHATQF